MLRIVLCALMLALTGCKHQVEMTFDFSEDAGFYANGFPTDLRVGADGLIDFTGFPRLQHPLTRQYVNATAQQIRGYALSMPIYLPFTGPFDRARLPQQDTAYLADDAPIHLVNIDPNSPAWGQRQPLSVAQTWQPDTYRPRHLLQILPTLGLNLLPNTTYAVLVYDRMPVHDGDVLQQNARLAALLDEPASMADDVTDKQRRAHEVFAPLRDYLAATGIDPASIVGATVWTTGDPTAQLFNAARQLAEGDVPTVELSGPVDIFADYCVFHGRIAVPGFQRGVLPYLAPYQGGDIEWDATGVPVTQYVRHAPLVVTVPRRPMPADGFPLLLYNHGTGGRADEVYVRGAIDKYGVQDRQGGPAQIAAYRGWGSAGMGGHLGDEHLPGPLELEGYIAYNFFNPVAWRGNMLQMALERVLLRRALNALQLDGDACPGATADGGPLHFDATMQAVMGQSLGSYIAGMQAAIDPEPYQGVILTGAGGSWIEFAFGPTDPVPLQQLVETLALQFSPIEHLDRFHPIPMLAEMLVGAANNILYTDQLLRYPRKTPPHVLVIEGHQDRQVPENIQRPLLLSLGVEPVGDDYGATQDDSVFWYLQEQGAQSSAYPVVGNTLVDGYGMRTAVVARYKPDFAPGTDGHHVAFQLDAPKHQYGCLLQQLALGQTPVIVEGYAADGDCF